MKIALCHLEISLGPEHKNIELLEMQFELLPIMEQNG